MRVRIEYGSNFEAMVDDFYCTGDIDRQQERRCTPFHAWQMC